MLLTESILARKSRTPSTDVKRLPRESAEAEALVMAKVACFGADKDVWRYSHRERRPNPKRRIAESLGGAPQAGLHRLVVDIERTVQAASDQCTISEQAKVRALLVGWRP